MLRSSGLPCSTRSAIRLPRPAIQEPPTATPDFDARTIGRQGVLGTRRPARPDHLVIDDLHELNCPEALDQLSRLLGTFPRNVNAILATRHDLRLRLHQLRLADELSEIRAAQLRFTERETRELLAASGIALSEADTALLCTAD